MARGDSRPSSRPLDRALARLPQLPVTWRPPRRFPQAVAVMAFGRFPAKRVRYAMS